MKRNVTTIIMQKEFNTVKITENCSNELTSFSNIYWATEDGFVWKSIQWLGNELSSDKDIYAEMYILKRTIKMVNIKIKKFFFVFNYLIFIIILIGSNSIITKSEGIKTSLDLMPVETNINVIELVF